MSKFGEFVGVGNVYAADVTSDNTSTYVVGSNSLIAPMASVSIAPTVNKSSRYYGDKAYFADAAEGDTVVTLVLPGVSMEDAASLLGKAYDTVSKRLVDSGKASAGYKALSFGVHAAEGNFVGFQFLKGKFAPWTEEAETIDGSGIKAKTVSLEYTAICTEYEGWDVGGDASTAKMVKGDSRLDPSLTETNWYSAVQKPQVHT